ncbi:MAG: hypothetical protein QM756_17780 [Polyangiaceae bacterium]
MSDEPVRLAASVEALLSAVPTPEREDWEALAAQIDQRVRETEAKSTAPLWLMAPLPDEAHEPGATARVEAAPAADSSGQASQNLPAAPPPPASLPSAAATPLPNPAGTPSLAALARSVAHKASRPESARIAQESLSAAAAARAQTEAVAERQRARPTPPPRRGEARPTPPPPPSARPAPSSAPRRSELGPWIAIGGLSFALAVALIVIARGREPQIVVAPAPPPVAAPSTPAAGVAVAAPQAAPVAPPQAEVVAAVPASALPLSPKPLGSVAAAAPRAGAEQLAMAARSAPAADVARPAPEAIQLEETPAKSKPVAVAAPEPAAATSGMRPAAGAPSGGLPNRPSTGAVQAAVGSVMGAARACVAGGAASQAQLTFGSDGAVTSVVVGPPAAGTAAASCIEGALKRARVAPFTNPSFSLGVWVRP